MHNRVCTAFFELLFFWLFAAPDSLADSFPVPSQLLVGMWNQVVLAAAPITRRAHTIRYSWNPHLLALHNTDTNSMEPRLPSGPVTSTVHSVFCGVVLATVRKYICTSYLTLQVQTPTFHAPSAFPAPTTARCLEYAWKSYVTP